MFWKGYVFEMDGDTSVYTVEVANTNLLTPAYFDKLYDSIYADACKRTENGKFLLTRAVVRTPHKEMFRQAHDIYKKSVMDELHSHKKSFLPLSLSPIVGAVYFAYQFSSIPQIGYGLLGFAAFIGGIAGFFGCLIPTAMYLDISREKHKKRLEMVNLEFL